MAETAYGRQVRSTYQGVKEELSAVRVWKKIGNRQGAYLASQNLRNMTKGLDRNGKRMAGYTKGYAKIRQKMGLATSPTNLKVTGDLYNDIRVRNVTVDTSRRVGPVVAFEIGVSEKNAKKLKGLTTGKLGRARRPPRDPIGMANTGTPMHAAQAKRMREIAVEELRSLRGINITFGQTAARGF